MAFFRLMPYAGEDFSPTSASSEENYGFDWSGIGVLAPGDAILSATFFLGVVVGNDPNVNSHFIGLPVVNGLIVYQKIGGLVTGVTYCITCDIVTVSGQTPSISANLFCIPDCTGYLP